MKFSERNSTAQRTTRIAAAMASIISVLVGTLALIEPTSASPQPTKADVVERLRTMQLKLTQEIGTLENSTKKRLNESTTISLKEDANISTRKITRLADQIADIDKKRTELLARRDFVDQLVLQVDSKWQGQALHKFLEHTILDMSLTDLTNPQGSGDLWRFCTFLSIAIREVPTGRDDVIGILEDYMNFASVLNPKTPAEFLAGRDYTNPTSSVSVKPAAREHLGDNLEEKLGLQSEKPKPTRATSPNSDIELRLRLPLAPPMDAKMTCATVGQPAPDCKK